MRKMIRRGFALLLGLLLVFTAFVAVAEGDPDFNIDTDGALVAYFGSDPDVVIPEGVTGISDQAFYNAGSIRSVVIPEGVTDIGILAFSGCFHLEGITLPSSLRTIAMTAFMDCFALRKVTLADGVTTIGESAFAYCESLESINLPASLTDIAPDAFEECAALVATVERGSYAEQYCIDNHISCRTTDSGSAMDSAGEDEGTALTDEERWQLNTFLSNFSVQNFCAQSVWDQSANDYARSTHSFPTEGDPTADMVMGAWGYVFVNMLETPVGQDIDGDWYTGYSLEAVNGALQRLFGIQLAESEIPQGVYPGHEEHPILVQDGYVYTNPADAGDFSNIALAGAVNWVDDTAIRVDFEVYRVTDFDIAPPGENIQDDSVYYMTIDDAVHSGWCEPQYSGSATIRVSGDLADGNFALESYEPR